VKAGGGGVFVSAAAPNDQWRSLLEIRPTAKGLTLRDADVAVGPRDELAVAYRWWRDDPRAKHIHLTRSTDGGKTWRDATNPVDPVGKAFDPKVAWGRDGALVVAWADERRGNRSFDVYARRSPDGGATWEPEQLLSRFSNTYENDIFARPVLLGDGGDRFWVVWVGVKGGRSSLYVNRSTDGGRAWTGPVAITGDSRSVYSQQVARVGERFLIVWQDR
jgi:hypothetical protein